MEQSKVRITDMNKSYDYKQSKKTQAKTKKNKLIAQYYLSLIGPVSNAHGTFYFCDNVTGLQYEIK